ncbi:MAG: translation initiation factor IF-2 [candidate division WS1 bacterium]|nr:translation initiation factor IF-2 [candidate division WS1 bacterium]
MANQVRIFQLAKKLGLRSEALLKVLADLGLEDVSAASSIDIATARAAAELLAEQAREARKRAEEEAEEERVRAEEEATVAAAAATAAEAEAEAPVETEEVAAAEEPVEVGSEGEAEAAPGETEAEEEEEEAPQRWVPAWAAPESLRSLEEQLAELEVELEEEEEAYVPLPEEARRPRGERPEHAVDVPPVVSVLGHVDHGKTTLLDALRETDVVAGESGGITQHIGASEVQVGDQTIVFVDTPGHAAFTQMRARGGQVADIVVLVVAADDGVMPQTIEAIGHAKAAGVPIIVAINKTDMPGADPDRVKQALLEYELVAEDFGGDTIMVPVSALRGDNLDTLLEMILLVAEVQELWADPNAAFAGVVVEAGMDESRGPVATILVRNGEVKVGDVVVCGTAQGRIRRLNDWRGKSVKSMGPGHPVEVIGLSDVPQAGQVMTAVDGIKQARELVASRSEVLRDQAMGGSARASLKDLYRELGELTTKDLNLMLKADVWGSVQALESALMELDERLEEVDINIISTGVGEVNESDVLLAVASNCIILGFRVGIGGAAERTSETEHVEIRTYDIIYEVLDDIQAAMLGMLDPVYEERVTGHGRVMRVFRISRIGVIAGTLITDGYVQRGSQMTVTRGREKIFEGKVESLKHFEQDVRRIESPNECGISTNAFRGWEEGDEIEFVAEVEVPRQTTFKSAR